LFAQLLAQRFEKATRRLGLNEDPLFFELDCTRFRPPSLGGQQSLF
jgi:hypothetical protein